MACAPHQEDTEWNSVLRNHGILPKEAEVTEEQLFEMLDQTIEEMANKEKSLEGKSLEELDELEDDLDDGVLFEYR
jgi:hypothetical protein